MPRGKVRKCALLAVQPPRFPNYRSAPWGQLPIRIGMYIMYMYMYMVVMLHQDEPSGRLASA